MGIEECNVNACKREFKIVFKFINIRKLIYYYLFVVYQKKFNIIYQTRAIIIFLFKFFIKDIR